MFASDVRSRRAVHVRSGCHRRAALPAIVCSNGEPARREGVEPPGHGPPTPAVVEEVCVANDVVDVLDGWIADRVMLVVGPSAADPGVSDTGRGGELPEIGVFGAVAGVLLAES